MQPEARWIATSGEAGAFRLDLEEALAVLSRTPGSSALSSRTCPTASPNGDEGEEPGARTTSWAT